LKLHENIQDFQTLIAATSQDLGIREVYVEKDYWLTLILKRLSQAKESAEIIFKGGTSLSKAYNIVRRFSEDIDLAVAENSRTQSQTEALLKRMAKLLTQPPFEEVVQDGVTNKKGKFRRTIHQYP